MPLRNMNIAPRAFPGFALIGALMLYLGVFVLNQMSKIRDVIRGLADQRVVAPGGGFKCDGRAVSPLKMWEGACPR